MCGQILRSHRFQRNNIATGIVGKQFRFQWGVVVVYIIPGQQCTSSRPPRTTSEDHALKLLRHLDTWVIKKFIFHIYPRHLPRLVGTVIEFDGCSIPISRYPVEDPTRYHAGQETCIFNRTIRQSNGKIWCYTFSFSCSAIPTTVGGVGLARHKRTSPSSIISLNYSPPPRTTLV